MTELEVIGAGFGRTGTLSLKAALDELGYNTHHMFVVMAHGQGKIWQDISAGKDVEENLEKALKGFTACVDYPTCGFFKELMQLSPKGKVLLSVRDSPEAWVKSANGTIMQEAYDHPWRQGILYHSMKWFPFIGNFLRAVNMLEINFNKCAVTNFVPKYPENRVQYYEDWIAHVKKTVPADNLLVFNVKQGWEPLCKFLGKPVPDKPFPRINDSAAFKRRQKIGRILFPVICITTYGSIGYAIYTGKLQKHLKAVLDITIDNAKKYLQNS